MLISLSVTLVPSLVPCPGAELASVDFAKVKKPIFNFPHQGLHSGCSFMQAIVFCSSATNSSMSSSPQSILVQMNSRGGKSVTIIASLSFFHGHCILAQPVNRPKRRKAKTSKIPGYKHTRDILKSPVRVSESFFIWLKTVGLSFGSQTSTIFPFRCLLVILP